MKTTDMTFKERNDMMRKRHAFLYQVAKQYTSLDDFAKERDEWFAIIGIELTHCEKYISLYISLGFNEYETYHIIHGKEESLTVSEVIWWQHPYCYNDVLNIFTKESVDEEDILTAIHDYGEETFPIPKK